MNRIRMTIISLIACILSCQAFAAGRARVEVNAVKTADGKLEMTFRTLPTDGLAINAEGPWKLEIKDAGALKFEKLEMKRGDWREKDASFSQYAVPSGKEKTTSIAYKLTAFVCTKDKGQCFREVIETKSQVNWQ